MFQPGEQSAEGFEGYLFNVTLTGVYAQEIGGAGLILERKPFPTSLVFAVESLISKRSLLWRFLPGRHIDTQDHAATHFQERTCRCCLLCKECQASL